MKGIFNRDHLVHVTLHHGDVLDFVSAQGKNDSLPLNQVTFKLTMLMALTNTGRSSDIHGLDLKV